MKFNGLLRAGFALIVGAALLGAEQLPASAISVAPGTISRVGEVKNYFNLWTAVFADPGRDLLFEYATPWGAGQPGAISLVELAGTDYHLLRQGRLVTTREGASGNGVLTVDSEDGLIIYGQPGVLLDGDQVAALSETTLDKVAEWDLPRPLGSSGAALNHIVGLQWLPDRRELVVTTDGGGGCSGLSCEISGDIPPHGVVVTDLKISPNLTATVLWSVSITGCERALSSYYDGGGAGLALHDPVMTVPCRLNGANLQAFATASDFSGPEVDGVVSVVMTSTGCSPGATVCPTSQMTSVVAPELASDFLFDPESDRGFMSHGPTTTGITIVGYDALHQEFMGRVTEGDGGSQSLGLDTSTGRYYSAGSAGIAFFDGRRTPLSPGSKFSQYKGAPPLVNPAFLAPDAGHPYRRLIINLPPGNSVTGAPMQVFADTVPIGSDPPAAAIDANTLDPSDAGNPNAQISTFGGTARGYGVHSDLVGSVEGVLANSGPYSGFVLTTYNAALGAGETDLLAGSLTGLRLDSGSAVGQAAALADGNGNTSLGLAECTDPEQVGACAGSVVPIGTGSAPKTAQLWPAPDAVCSDPGASATGTAAGIYSTSWTTGPGGSPTPTQSVIPGTDQAGIASAEVNCAADAPTAGSATGAAVMQGYGLEPPGAPSITVASALSSGTVSPAAGSPAATRTVVVAVARGIRVSDGAGHELRIGEVEQVATALAGGRPGSAATTDAVTLSDVVTVAGGSTQVICAGVCQGDPQQVIARINAGMPGLIRVSMPKADDRLTGKTGNASPGGYLAVVQANVAEQYGDQQFNGMSAEEASLLPALRVVIYDDGEAGLSREVLDLAGVEADAKLGLALGLDGGLRVESAESTLQEALAAGLPPSQLSQNLPTPAGSAAGGIRAVIAGLGHGFEWLRRSPAAAIQMLLMLLLLGSPALLMARRKI